MIYLGIFFLKSRTLRALLTSHHRRALQEQVNRREKKGIHNRSPKTHPEP